MQETFDTMTALSMLVDGYSFCAPQTETLFQRLLFMSSNSDLIKCEDEFGVERDIPMRTDWTIAKSPEHKPIAITFEFSIEESRESCGLDALVDYLETDIDPGEYTVRIEYK